MTSEQWRPVVGYESRYEVSDKGNVRSLDMKCPVLARDGKTWNFAVRKGRLLKQAAAKRGAGYLQVTLCAGRDDHKSAHVHRLVLEAFVGLAPAGLEACHNDGNPKNNALSNLRWDTRRENAADRVEHGTATIGEKHPMAKLTKEQALEIRTCRSDALPMLAKHFGITVAHAQKIKSRQAWKVLP